jgi:hypothetical protein
MLFVIHPLYCHVRWGLGRPVRGRCCPSASRHRTHPPCRVTPSGSRNHQLRIRRCNSRFSIFERAFWLEGGGPASRARHHLHGRGRAALSAFRPTPHNDHGAPARVIRPTIDRRPSQAISQHQQHTLIHSATCERAGLLPWPGSFGRSEVDA